MELSPLSGFGAKMINLCASYPEVPQDHQRVANRLCSAEIKDSAQPALRERQDLVRNFKRPVQVVQVVHGHIYVEFSLGANVLARFGTELARETSKKSPLCRAYQQQKNALARRRAGLSS